MFYDEYELLELFESEPRELYQEGAGFYMYKKVDKLGFQLLLYISQYEHKCNVSLSSDMYRWTIFEFELYHIESIRNENECLKIRGNSGKTEIDIQCKPHFSLTHIRLSD
ncbi:hypothetical protein BLD48_08565 [Exiguobacterium sp. KRL4]|nr:hypothetical protein BLD48_08565 [Exiguobacterium sp. KRL4]